MRSGDTFLRDNRRYVVVSVTGPEKAPEIRAVREGSEAHRLAAHEIQARTPRPPSISSSH